MHKLDLNTINQIAAGEVVENPSSVVKELLENALDAGATRIKVVLKKGGLEEISVLDDGSGIPAGEVRLALERHATSKISSSEDLFQVNTLGFRGEALPSIAAVSRLFLTTRHQAEDIGTEICLEGGEEKEFKERGFARGTMVTVKDLFFNLPVRRKFLRSIAAESAQVTRTMEVLALSHPDTSFTLERDGKIQLETSGDGNLLNTVLQLFGHKLAPHLLPVHWQNSIYGLEGFVSSPSLSLKSRSHQLFYINRRHVRNHLLREALERSYARFVTAKRYPLAFLFLTMPTEELDVNVHPAKTEVRFRQKKPVFDFLFTGITRAYQAPLNREGSIKTPLQEKEGQPLNLFFHQEDEPDSLLRETAPHDQTFIQPLQHPKGEEEREQEREQERGLNREQVWQTEQEEDNRLATGLTPDRQVLGQLFSTYILLQQGNELLLVDQHAAHERILWEECRERRAGEEHYLQEVLPFPQELELPLPENFFSEEKIKLLAELGLELEQFGNTSIIIRSVPFFLKDIYTARLLADLVQELAAESSNLAGRDWQEAALLQLTCKAAVKANQVLGREEIEGLLAQLERCENPAYCPHGRPVITRLTRNELEKMFHRR